MRKEVVMPRYVVLYRFTAEGAKNIRETVQRARQTREQGARGQELQEPPTIGRLPHHAPPVVADSALLVGLLQEQVDRLKFRLEVA